MSHMQKQIQKGSWLLIDGNCGTDAVPAELFSRAVLATFGATHAEWTADADSEGFEALCESVRDYTENSDIREITMKRGYGARLSAPGYMDCTAWAVYDSEEEAEEALVEMYGDDEESDTDS